MNGRERLRRTLRREPTDRAPIDLGSTAVTGIQAAHLRARAPGPGPQGRAGPGRGALPDPGRGRGAGAQGPRHRHHRPAGPRHDLRLPERGLEALDAARRHAGPRLGALPLHVDDKGDTLLFPKGDTSASPSGRLPKGGYYFDAIIRQGPLDEEHLDPQDWAEQFTSFTDEDLRDLETRSLRLYEDTEYSLVGCFGQAGVGDIAFVPGQMLRVPKGLRDPNLWYEYLASHPDYIRGIFDLWAGNAMRNLELYRQAVGDRIDVIFMGGTDFGGQRGTLVSPKMFRELFKPYYKSANDWVHRNTGWKTFYHSCGSVAKLLDDFVDMGVDILNPVQCSAVGMEPEGLKAKYGDRLVFWGGGVDTQQTMPFGTAAEVRAQAGERLRILGGGGGLRPLRDPQHPGPHAGGERARVLRGGQGLPGRRVGARAVRFPVARAGSLLLLAVLAGALPAAPQEPTSPAPARPRLALALSGGGARGIAHIGALRALEEAGIPIDAIAGNSMGAVVGSIYASGRNVAELQAIVLSLDWATLFSGRPDRSYVPVARREDRYGSTIGVDFDWKGARLPGGLLSDHRIDAFLIEQLAPANYAAGGDFDRLPVPFRCVATALDNGERVVLARGDLARAVRASMSIPLVFPPVDWNGRPLVDGMVVDNLPVDVARELGAAVVVAVDIGSPDLEPAAYDNALGVAGQVSDLLMTARNQAFAVEARRLRAPRSGQALRRGLLGLRPPDRPGLRGDEAGHSRDPAEARGRGGGRRLAPPRPAAGPQLSGTPIAEVRIEGNQRLSESLLRRIFNIPVGPPLLPPEVPAGLRQGPRGRAPLAGVDGIRTCARGAADRPAGARGAAQPRGGLGRLRRGGQGPGGHPALQPRHARLRRGDGAAPGRQRRGDRRGAVAPGRSALRARARLQADRLRLGRQAALLRRRGRRGEPRAFRAPGIRRAPAGGSASLGAPGGGLPPRACPHGAAERDRPPGVARTRSGPSSPVSPSTTSTT